MVLGAPLLKYGMNEDLMLDLSMKLSHSWSSEAESENGWMIKETVRVLSIQVVMTTSTVFAHRIRFTSSDPLPSQHLSYQAAFGRGNNHETSTLSREPAYQIPKYPPTPSSALEKFDETWEDIFSDVF